ncbi:DUF4873 domain-containing protein [Pseudonocardiaceae bacterium YIM PH 21723]|nr:DUF4873 domain-containing protein [Pseudonocardiaceae bacterium YIM PH 21723]
MSADHEHDGEEYRGPATVIAGDQVVEVTAQLRGRFEPIDGRFRWYGRLNQSEAVTSLTGGRSLKVVLRTPQGEAEGQLSDPDPWGRLRVTGMGRPPFHYETTPPDA